MALPTYIVLHIRVCRPCRERMFDIYNCMKPGQLPPAPEPEQVLDKIKKVWGRIRRVR